MKSADAELALLSRNLVMQAKVPASPDALKSTLAALNWLEQIAVGKLLVVPAPGTEPQTPS